MCALNNAVGADVFTFPHMERAVQVLVDESIACSLQTGSLGGDTVDQHMNANGWFSDEALARALVIDGRWAFDQVPHLAARPRPRPSLV